jgi:hypothetical protein
MWADFSGRAYSRVEFAARIAGLQWTDWRPVGITLHNTAAPTLAQWAESGPAHDARIRNLQSYYEGLGWHGGPHWFISRNWLNEFSNPLRRGTHSPSFNATHLGIEMVGDFAREPFYSGDGDLVSDYDVFALAVLCRRFVWNPDTAIKLHKEDPKTTHDCPGKFVVKADMIARVKAEMARLAGKPVAPLADNKDGPADPPPAWKAPDHPAFKPADIFEAKAAGIVRDLMADFGLTDVQAAGIVGNLGHECAGFTLMQEQRPASGAGGYGWAQWTGPRRVAFMAWCAAHKLTPESDAGNYGFLRHELQTTEARAITAVKQAATLYSAMLAFETAFERAGVKRYDSRLKYAERALAAYRAAVPARAVAAPKLPGKVTAQDGAAAGVVIVAAAAAQQAAGTGMPWWGWGLIAIGTAALAAGVWLLVKRMRS